MTLPARLKNDELGRHRCAASTHPAARGTMKCHDNYSLGAALWSVA